MNRLVSRWVITFTLLCCAFNHVTFFPDLSRGILGQRLTFEAEGACMTMLVTNLAPGYRIDAMVHIGNGVVLLSLRERSSSPGSIIYRSTDYATTWTNLGNITGEDITVIAPAGGGIVYLTTASSVVWKSIDAGLTWASLGQISTATTEGGFARSYGLVVTNAGAVLLSDTGNTGGQIYRSTNGGTNWTPVQTLGDRGLYRLQKVGSDVVIVNGWAGRVFRSTNDGVTWTEAQWLSTLPLYATEYLGTNIVLQGSEDGRVFRSTNNAVSFTTVDTPGGAADDFVYGGGTAVVFSTYTGDKHLFVSTDAGVTWVSAGTIEEIIGIGNAGDWADHMIRLPGAILIGTNFGYVVRLTTLGAAQFDAELRCGSR